MKNRILFVGLVLLSSWSFPAYAEDETGFCQDYALDGKHKSIMPRLASISEGIVDRFCAGQMTSELAIANSVYQLSVASEDSFKVNDQSVFPIVEVNRFIQEVLLEEKTAPNFIEMPLAQGIGFKSGVDNFSVPADKRDACEQLARENQAESCRDYIQAYYAIYHHAQLLIQKLDTAPVLKYLNIAEREWENYYSKGRSQTILERAVNGYLWRSDKKPGQFLPPPETQYILLHPSLVIENVSDALDGSNTEEGIMLEWVGMNRWQRDAWYQLSGFSLVSVYSDRAEIDDWGHGVALHFGNQFTFGAVDHDGSAGVYISLDVLALFKDKKTYLDGYLGKL